MCRMFGNQLAIIALASLTAFGPAFAQSSGAKIQASQPATFVERAIEMNRAEIQLSNVAMSRAQDSRVKDFATMMVRDHTQALNKLERLQLQTDNLGNKATAVEQGIGPDQAAEARQKPPVTLTKEHQQALDRVSRLSGAQFDREFMDLIVVDHQAAVRMFEQEAGTPATSPERVPPPKRTNPDPAVRTQQNSDTAVVARELLPTLQQHLTQAEQIQRQLKMPNGGR